MNWISVEDRLPNEYVDKVLVARNWGVKAKMEATYIDGKFMTCNLGLMQEFKNPTHWILLDDIPEPPEEEV